MPALSEEVYSAEIKSSADVVSWLSTKFSALTTGETDKWKITRFDTTPPMSTYIVAFANGPFSYLEDSYKSPLSGKVRPLRIYSELPRELLLHSLDLLLHSSDPGPHSPGQVCPRRQKERVATLRGGLRYRVSSPETRHACGM